MKTYWLANSTKKAGRAVRRVKAAARKALARRRPKKSFTIAKKLHHQRSKTYKENTPMARKRHRWRHGRRNPVNKAHYKHMRRKSWTSSRRRAIWFSNPGEIGSGGGIFNMAKKAAVPALAVVGGLLAAFGIVTVAQRNTADRIQSTGGNMALKYGLFAGASLLGLFAGWKMKMPLLTYMGVGAFGAGTLEGLSDAGVVSFQRPTLTLAGIFSRTAAAPATGTVSGLSALFTRSNEAPDVAANGGLGHYNMAAWGG